MTQPGVQVFTTCGAQKKRDYLQQTFPFLDDAHIGDSRSTSFEDLIKEQVCNLPCLDVLRPAMHCNPPHGKGCRLSLASLEACTLLSAQAEHVSGVQHGTAWPTEADNADKWSRRRPGAEVAGQCRDQQKGRQLYEAGLNMYVSSHCFPAD